MSQKTVAIVSCIVLFFICAVCTAGFGLLYILRSNQTLPPTGGVACTLEAKVCPDGSAVGRNPKNNCEFDACPATGAGNGGGIACTDDVKMCPDGSYVSRKAPDCSFAECPTTPSNNEEPKLCTQDIKVCPDGSSVSRDPSNNCEFKTCK